MSLPILVLVAGLSYLLGSIPFGLLLTRAFGAGDLRKIGSGNIGATNVLRTGRRELAAATLVLDGGKGAVAVLIAGMFGLDAAIVAASCAVLGHLFPVWLRFKGGKGVATTLGVLLALTPFTGLAACLVWLAVAVLSRYSSLAALVAIGTSPLTAWLFYDPERAGLALFLTLLVLLRHHENIARLRAGKESPIKLGRSA